MGNIKSSTKGQDYDTMGESNRSVPQIGLGWCLEPNVTGVYDGSLWMLIYFLEPSNISGHHWLESRMLFPDCLW